MSFEMRAAVLHAPRTPLKIENIGGGRVKPTDVVVRVKAAGLCHTDLEVIEGSLRYPMPIVLGHEAAGIVEEAGPEAKGVAVGDHVILSWNPHCGHCFYCDRDLPILCETYLAEGPKAVAFDGDMRTSLQQAGKAFGFIWGKADDDAIFEQRAVRLAFRAMKRLLDDTLCIHRHGL